MIRLESILRRSERALTQQVSDTLVLLHLDTAEYYTLNEVGCYVWKLCDGTRQVVEILALLCQEYDAPAEIIKADVGNLLQDLAYEKLVVEGDPKSGDTTVPA